MYTRLYMGDKLYWRTKKNGKWTWRPVSITDRHVLRQALLGGEEE